jgi:hypothetical protein
MLPLQRLKNKIYAGKNMDIRISIFVFLVSDLTFGKSNLIYRRLKKKEERI